MGARSLHARCTGVSDRDQFISLLMVGDAGPNGHAPIIPIDHETLFIRLGYVVNLQGRLRMTTPGRRRIESIEATPEPCEDRIKAAR
jgi:hypothetical protein